MNPWIKALLCITVAVVILLIDYLVIKSRSAKGKLFVEEEDAVEEVPAPVEEVPAPVEETAEEAPVEVVEEVAVADVNEGIDVAKRVAFAEKLLGLDEKVHGYYDAIYNKFISLRKINPRVSTKGVSFRLGRKLVARLTIRGKTMRLHLALDCNAFDQKIYFQKDMGDVKSYAEIPMMVKVRSDRGFKNAMKLVDALIEKEAIEAKTRYNAVNAVSNLKDTIA
ncbi:MAG: hypothetical protein IJC07_06445 [Clostridia bacterium]|nr:hypothetical protein [Clostridia bacterium]